MLCIISLIPGGSLSSFFNDPTVRNSLNAPSIEEHPYWSGCVPGAGRRRRLERRNQRDLVVLENDRPLSVVTFIAELLDDAHLDILMYNGDLDLAVTSQGTELSLESMEWSGAEALRGCLRIEGSDRRAVFQGLGGIARLRRGDGDWTVSGELVFCCFGPTRDDVFTVRSLNRLCCRQSRECGGLPVRVGRTNTVSSLGLAKDVGGLPELSLESI